MYHFKRIITSEIMYVIYIHPYAWRYGVVVVKLDKGPMITVWPIGFDPKKPEKIEVGMKAKADFIQELEQTILSFNIS